MEKLIEIGIFLVLLFVVITVFNGKDDTDSKKERSGFILYTDYGTGNQYISTLLDFTGHKPRLDKDGKQVNIYTNPAKFSKEEKK